MTYQFGDPRANGAKRRSKKDQPFDPDELSRRLTTYLIDQKQRAERRRIERAAKLAAEQEDIVYHHIPTVAATAFARTATPDTHRQVHKLSKPALKQNQEAFQTDQLTNLQKMQALDQAIIDRNVLGHRNQFQWSHDMVEAAEVDIHRGVYEPPRRTFATQFAHLDLRSRRDKEAERPLSLGDVWEEDSPTMKTRNRPRPDFEGRNDWSQQDDVEIGKTEIKEKSNTFLRKTESIWVLKSRTRNRTDTEGKSDGVCKDVVPADGGKSGKGSFLARFKRHPS